MESTDQEPAQLDKSPVVKALRVLCCIAQSGEPITLAGLSRSLALPKATVHRLARMLEETGFIQKSPLTLRYSVGRRFEDVALDALRNGGGANRRRLLMDELSRRLDARINFAVLKAGKVTLVEWVESSSPIRIDLRPDIQAPAHCCASGKLLMAFGPDELRERFLAAAPFRALTKFTITNSDAMRHELAMIRTRGFAEDQEEFLMGIRCLAAPVRNGSGQVVAGLGVMAPAYEFTAAKARQSFPIIRTYAGKISAEYEKAKASGPLGGDLHDIAVEPAAFVDSVTPTAARTFHSGAKRAISRRVST